MKQKRPLRKVILRGAAISVLAVLAALSIELYSPKEIGCRVLSMPGDTKTVLCKDLIVQEAAQNGRMRATRGRWVYSSEDGIRFKREFKAPLSSDYKLLLADLHSFRSLIGLQEICEVFTLRSGTILVFYGGKIWRSEDEGITFESVHTLRHFGYNVGRGVMPQGMTQDREGNAYYGEYFRNDERGEVRLYKSDDDGRTWHTAHRFAPGQMRHIHAVQYDPYEDSIWIATGDTDKESSIRYSKDGGRIFTSIGEGDQSWRAVSLIFTKKKVIWGSDSSLRQNWIYYWDRESGQASKVAKVDGPIFYSTVLSDSTMVLARNVEGGKGEWDDAVSLWICKDGEHWARVLLGERDNKNKFAVCRIPRGQTVDALYLSPLNVHFQE